MFKPLSKAWPEKWPRDDSDHFGLPPLETSSNGYQKRWRGIRLATIFEEFYYEPDDYDDDRDGPPLLTVGQADAQRIVCVETGEPLPEVPSSHMLNKHSPAKPTWHNMLGTALMSTVMLAPGLSEALPFLEKGLSNPVPVDQLSLDAFRIPREDEDESCGLEGFDWLSCVNIAVSYTHQAGKESRSQGSILKASPEQLEQLEDILRGLREHTPEGVKYIRLWTDQILSARLRAEDKKKSNHVSWIVYGLVPYLVYTVAYLHADHTADAVSMWCACEQVLADANSGVLIAVNPNRKLVTSGFCKDLFSWPDQSCSAALVIGDGLSMARSFERLAFAVHSGLFDDTVTFHIADAQALIRFTYYVIRNDGMHPLFHGLNCEGCLTVTRREQIGFNWAVYNAADLWNEEAEADIQKRISRDTCSYAFPKARARAGFVRWHGYREFAPGAGRVARFAEPPMSTHFTSHTYAMRVADERYCIALAAVPYRKETWMIHYIALLVHGRDLYDVNENWVDWSVRLNFRDLEKFHRTFSTDRTIFSNTDLSEWFRHPELDELISQLHFANCGSQLPVLSQLCWGANSPEEAAASSNTVLTTGHTSQEEQQNGQVTSEQFEGLLGQVLDKSAEVGNEDGQAQQRQQVIGQMLQLVDMMNNLRSAMQ